MQEERKISRKQGRTGTQNEKQEKMNTKKNEVNDK